jgi:hypothetical protein
VRVRCLAHAYTLVVAGLLSSGCAQKQPQPILIPIHLVVRNHTGENVTVRVRIAEAVVFHAPAPAAPPEGPLVIAQELRAPPALASVDARVGARTLQYSLDLPYAAEVWLIADVYRDRVHLSARYMSPHRDSVMPEGPVRIPATLQN